MFKAMFTTITALIIANVALVGCRGDRGEDGIGVQGAQGRQGETGTTGADGSNGQDATPVTVVPLCPGSSNYGTFVEVGICLNGRLYGVYSTHGGFLTLLADGDYSSNAIGSACNLTVSGCTVSH